MMTDVYNNNLFLDILLHIEWKWSLNMKNEESQW